MIVRGATSELTDKAWQRIEPLLSATDGRGRPWRDHREVINGILWRLRIGAPWRDIPERYGPWQTCYERFKRWDEDGTWARILEDLQVKDDSIGTVPLLCQTPVRHGTPAPLVPLASRHQARSQVSHYHRQATAPA